MAAVLCYGVRGGGGQLCFHVTVGNYDTDTLIEVLSELQGPVSSLKAVELANLGSPTLAEVIDQVAIRLPARAHPARMGDACPGRRGLSNQEIAERRI